MLKTLRQTALQATNTPVFGSLLRVLDKVNVARPSVLAVVTYHRVDEASRTPYLYPGLISASPAQFAEQIDLLSEACNVVSMQQVLSAVSGETELPVKSVLITFDDACTDFADFAWPVLQTRKLPVTVFVPTAYPDHPQRRFWWDRLHAALWHGATPAIDTACGQFELQSNQQRSHAMRTIRDHVKTLDHDQAMEFIDNVATQVDAPLPPASVLGWDQLRELAAAGVTLAPHTQTHPLLTRIPIEDARREVVGSRDDLQREIGDVLPVCAYPGGQCNQAVSEMMRDEGFEIGFTVERGVNDIGHDDLLSLNRINVGQNTNRQILRAQLMAGWWKKRA